MLRRANLSLSAQNEGSAPLHTIRIDRSQLAGPADPAPSPMQHQAVPDAVLSALALLAATAVSAPLTIVVLPFEHDDDVPASTAELAQAVATAALARDDSLTVVSSADVTRMLELSADRALLGCANDDGACTADIAAALGATHLITGHVAATDEGLWAIALTLVDGDDAHSVARETVRAEGTLALSTRLRIATARLLATLRGVEPPPMPPLVVERRMSDPSALLAATVVGVTTGATAAACLAPWTLVTTGIAASVLGFSFLGPGAALLGLAPPFVVATTAITSLLVDAVSDDAHLTWLRALSSAAGAFVGLALTLPAVLGGALFLGTLYATSQGYTFDDPTSPYAVAPYAVVLALSPLLLVGSALGSAGGSLVGVALFDDARSFDEPSEEAP